MDVGVQETGEEEPGEGARDGLHLRDYAVFVEYSPREDSSIHDVDDVALDRPAHASHLLCAVYWTARNCEKMFQMRKARKIRVSQNGIHAKPRGGAGRSR